MYSKLAKGLFDIDISAKQEDVLRQLDECSIVFSEFEENMTKESHEYLDRMGKMI